MLFVYFCNHFLNYLLLNKLCYYFIFILTYLHLLSFILIFSFSCPFVYDSMIQYISFHNTLFLPIVPFIQATFILFLFIHSFIYLLVDQLINSLVLCSLINSSSQSSKHSFFLYFLTLLFISSNSYSFMHSLIFHSIQPLFTLILPSMIPLSLLLFFIFSSQLLIYLLYLPFMFKCLSYNRLDNIFCSQYSRYKLSGPAAMMHQLTEIVPTLMHPSRLMELRDQGTDVVLTLQCLI